MKKDLGKVFWITGLSASGKSSVAIELRNILMKENHPTVLLDGDELRAIFGVHKFSDGNHNLESRKSLAMQYSKLCKFLSDQSINVVIATISLYKEVYKLNRDLIENYFEIFLDIPVEILKKRDPKNIYSNFEKGLLKNVIGLDIAFDEPNPHLKIKFSDNLSSNQIAWKIKNEFL